MFKYPLPREEPFLTSGYLAISYCPRGCAVGEDGRENFVDAAEEGYGAPVAGEGWVSIWLREENCGAFLPAVGDSLMLYADVVDLG